MRWPWSKRPPPAPEIPPYAPPVNIKPIEPKDPGIVVDEVDTTDMSATGIHKAWDRLTGRFKGE